MKKLLVEQVKGRNLKCHVVYGVKHVKVIAWSLKKHKYCTSVSHYALNDPNAVCSRLVKSLATVAVMRHCAQ